MRRNEFDAGVNVQIPHNGRETAAGRIGARMRPMEPKDPDKLPTPRPYETDGPSISGN